MSRTWTPDRVQAMGARLAAGISVAVVAGEFGTSPGRIRQLAYRYGFKDKPQRRLVTRRIQHGGRKTERTIEEQYYRERLLNAPIIARLRRVEDIVLRAYRRLDDPATSLILDKRTERERQAA